MILTSHPPWWNTSLTMAGLKEDISLGNIEKYATKGQGCIATTSLINTWKFITVVDFPVLIHRWGLASWNINIVWTKVSLHLCVCLPSIFYFTCWTHFLCLFSSCLIDHSLLQPLYLLCLKFWPFIFCWLFECMWSQSCKTYNMYWPSLCLYKSILNMGMIWCKKNTSPFLTKILTYK